MSFPLNLKISKGQKIKYIKDQFLTFFKTVSNSLLIQNFQFFIFLLMPQKRNSLIKRASLYPLSFDNPPTTPPARGIRGRSPSRDALSQTSPPVRRRSSSRALSARSYSQDSSRNLDSYDGIFHLDFSYDTFFNTRIWYYFLIIIY